MLEISSVQLEYLIKESPNLVLIDIRENHEMVNGKVTSAMHIPWCGLTFLLPNLERDKHYVIICRKGSRSKLAVKLMRSYGFHASCLKGGYHALEVCCDHLVAPAF